MKETLRPIARRSDLLVEELDDGFVVYDEIEHTACALNRTAAIVWRNLDGERDVQDLVEVLREEVGEVADEDLVMMALDRLEERGLIESGYPGRDPESARFSRRRFIRAAGVAAVVALPVIDAVVAPTPAAALSVVSK